MNIFQEDLDISMIIPLALRLGDIKKAVRGGEVAMTRQKAIQGLIIPPLQIQPKAGTIYSTAVTDEASIC